MKEKRKKKQPKYLVIHSTGQQQVYSPTEAGTVVRMMLLDGKSNIKIQNT